MRWKYAKLALAQAPDSINRTPLTDEIATLERSQNWNSIDDASDQRTAGRDARSTHSLFFAGIRNVTGFFFFAGAGLAPGSVNDGADAFGSVFLPFLVAGFAGSFADAAGGSGRAASGIGNAVGDVADFSGSILCTATGATGDGSSIDGCGSTTAGGTAELTAASAPSAATGFACSAVFSGSVFFASAPAFFGGSRNARGLTFFSSADPATATASARRRTDGFT